MCPACMPLGLEKVISEKYTDPSGATAGDVFGGRVDDLELALPPVGALSGGGTVLGLWARIRVEHGRLASFISGAPEPKRLIG